MTLQDLEKALIAQGGHMSGIYKITHRASGKVYIGQSICIVDRIIQHIKNIAELDSEKIDGAIQKYGWTDFEYEVVLALPELNTEQLWAAESQYITKYDSCNNGYNKTKGNHIGKFDHETFIKKNVISVELTKTIQKHFNLSYCNQRVLVIGLIHDHWLNALKYFDCDIVLISKYFEDNKEAEIFIREELKHYMGQHFDLVIANTPYGQIGANITDLVAETIDYTDFINLLPANDYKRNTTKDLYQRAELESLLTVKGAFGDAAVTTLVARINKVKDPTISWDAFEITSYSDPILKKYFLENRNRSHYAIDHMSELHTITNPDANYTFYLAGRDINHKHLPWKNGKYTEESLTYLWNVKKISYEEAKKYSQPHAIAKGEAYFYGNTITFKTTTEKDNFTAFVYDNRLFINKLFTAVNADGRFVLGKLFPKVDWSRAWTVEEILAEFGYTETEIEEVMSSLVEPTNTERD